MQWPRQGTKSGGGYARVTNTSAIRDPHNLSQSRDCIVHTAGRWDEEMQRDMSHAAGLAAEIPRTEGS